MAQYNYPNARNNPNSAIPVYIVAAPTPAPRYPNKQNNPQGAIPVNFVAQPTTPDSGAIPVLVVAGPGVPDSNGRWPSDQRQARGAIPVFNSTSTKAMPVWNAVPLPAPPIVINADFHTNTSLNVGQDVGTVTAYNNPTGWSIISGNPNGNMFVITYNGRIVLLYGPIPPGVYTLTVQATNADGSGQGFVTIHCLLRK